MRWAGGGGGVKPTVSTGEGGGVRCIYYTIHDTISEENLLLFLHQARNTQKTQIALRIHKSKDQRYACFFKSVDRLLAVTITVNRLKH